MRNEVHELNARHVLIEMGSFASLAQSNNFQILLRVYLKDNMLQIIEVLASSCIFSFSIVE
jgi:hypothetical protein